MKTKNFDYIDKVMQWHIDNNKIIKFVEWVEI